MNNDSIKRKIKKILPLLGLVIFLIVVSRLNLKNYFALAKNIKILPIFIAFPVILLMLTTKAWRWKIIIARQGIKYKFNQTFLLYLSGLYFGAMTPGRLGELGKIYYLKKDRHSTTTALYVTLADKFIDLAFILIVITVNLSYLYHQIQIKWLSLVSILILLIVLLLLPCIIITYSAKLKNKIKTILHEIIIIINKYSTFDWLKIVILTALSWLFYYLLAYLFTLAINIHNISFWYVANVMNIASAVSSLPISFMGVGTRDAIFVLLYSAAGQTPESAIAVSLMILTANLMITGGGYCAWLYLHKKYY